MNHWHTEFMAEYQRQRTLEELEQIHLEKIALQSRSNRPGLLGRTLFSLANWMISIGYQLRRRYEVPVTRCNPPPAAVP